MTPTAGEKLVKTFYEPGGNALATAAFSPNGALVVTSSSDGTARIWDWDATGPHKTQMITEPRSDYDSSLNSAEFSPNGKLILTSSEDGTARVWSAATLQELGPAVTEPSFAHLTDAQFGDDGRTIVTSSSDGTARIWDPVTGLQLIAFAGHSVASPTSPTAPIAPGS